MIVCHCSVAAYRTSQDLYADYVSTLVNIILCLYKDSTENQIFKSGFSLTQDVLSPVTSVPNEAEMLVTYAFASKTQYIISLCTIRK